MVEIVQHCATMVEMVLNMSPKCPQDGDTLLIEIISVIP